MSERPELSPATPIRALIADDEPLARAFLRRLLEDAGGFAIVAEAADGREAVTSLRTHAPEVAFLDIRMPHLDGLAAARAAAGQTLAVFVTAYDKYALAAFEAGGCDYLVKPIDRERFFTMLEKVRRDVRRRRIEAIFEREAAHTLAGDAPYLEHLTFRTGNATRYLAACDIVWLEAANQYVSVHAKTGSAGLVSDSLNSFQKKLDPKAFFRVHRSAIVNRAHIESVRTKGTGAVFLEMSNGARVPISRRFKAALARVVAP